MKSLLGTTNREEHVEEDNESLGENDDLIRDFKIKVINEDE